MPKKPEGVTLGKAVAALEQSKKDERTSMFKREAYVRNTDALNALVSAMKRCQDLGLI